MNQIMSLRLGVSRLAWLPRVTKLGTGNCLSLGKGGNGLSVTKIENTVSAVGGIFRGQSYYHLSEVVD